MEELRKSIIQCLDQNEDEQVLLAEFNKIIEEYGQDVYRIILHILTSLDMQPAEAEESWHQIITQWENMNKAIGRPVSIRTAICDYFCSIQKSLRNPKVVEIHIFEKTVKDSNFDNLTGLFNRNCFDRALEREVALAKRYDKDLSILFFDIDDFKNINDTYGHQAGDEVLKCVANIIMNEKRTGDIAGRYGGEEMVVILPYTSNVDALVLGERIRQKVELTRLQYDGETITFTLSGGLVSFPVDAREAESLMKFADSALYRAKGSGKNNISLFSQDRRRYLRVKYQREIDIKELGFIETSVETAESKNIGMGGILFEHNTPLPIGSRIQISLPFGENGPLLIIGTVVRVETYGPKKYDIGISISFQEMDKLTKREISKYLSRELKENAGIQESPHA